MAPTLNLGTQGWTSWALHPDCPHCPEWEQSWLALDATYVREVQGKGPSLDIHTCLLEVNILGEIPLPQLMSHLRVFSLQTAALYFLLFSVAPIIGPRAAALTFQ